MQTSAPTVNVARRLTALAALQPDALAVAAPRTSSLRGPADYDRLTFRELEIDSSRIASGLRHMGVVPGTRLALLVRPGIDFVSLVFALFKAGAVAILIDPGMGRKNLIACLAETRPEGFVAIPMVQAIRTVLGRRFPVARFNVTVGRRLFWNGTTLAELRTRGDAAFEPAETRAEDPAAIIFTTGSTGPPKGVLYRHGNFDAQVEELRDFYHLAPGAIDLPGFPLFGLFNGALGASTIIPDMDPTRPARVDPNRLLAAIRDWKVSQSFGSPAIWNRVGRHCEQTGERIESLRRVFSAGAPVPAHVLERMQRCLPAGAEIHTPYGATEALPVASIEAGVVLGETQARTREGAGVCVGHRFPRMRWKVIRIVDGPIAAIGVAEELPPGEIGELIVSGPVVTREYVTRCEWNALAKIPDGETFWHRMGDAGYLDAQDRFWYCGRVAHRVLAAEGVLYSAPCEAIFETHPAVYRAALVGVGPAGQQRPVIVVECWPDRRPRGKSGQAQLCAELREIGGRHELTRGIADFLIHPAMPVDIRHNAKIFREKLAPWAAGRLAREATRHDHSGHRGGRVFGPVRRRATHRPGRASAGDGPQTCSRAGGAGCRGRFGRHPRRSGCGQSLPGHRRSPTCGRSGRHLGALGNILFRQHAGHAKRDCRLPGRPRGPPGLHEQSQRDVRRRCSGGRGRERFLPRGGCATIRIPRPWPKPRCWRPMDPTWPPAPCDRT